MHDDAAVGSGATVAHRLADDGEDDSRFETSTGQSRADRLVPLPENVSSLAVARRSWNGVNLDVISARCEGRVAHHLCQESHTRLGALLEEVRSPCEPRLREHEPCPMPYVPRHLHFVPAGLPVWGYSADMRFVKDAVLTFDLETVSERLEQTRERDRVTTPRLRFADEPLWMLVKLLADVIDVRDPSTQLYGRLVAAGAVPITWGAVLGEWQRDWAREGTVAGVAGVLAEHGGGSGVAFAWELQLLAGRPGAGV